MKGHAETVRAVFAAFQQRDRAAIEPLLADALRFTSPYDDAIDRVTYFARCWPSAARIVEHVIEQLVIDGDSAFVTYLARVVDGAEFRNTEYMTFDAADRIATIHVYFGESYRDGAFIAKMPG